ncbi:hypothetical protein RUND412_008426 [Rhizina undulata]
MATNEKYTIFPCKLCGTPYPLRYYEKTAVKGFCHQCCIGGRVKIHVEQLRQPALGQLRRSSRQRKINPKDETIVVGNSERLIPDSVNTDRVAATSTSASDTTLKKTTRKDSGGVKKSKSKSKSKPKSGSKVARKPRVTAHHSRKETVPLSVADKSSNATTASPVVPNTVNDIENIGESPKHQSRNETPLKSHGNGSDNAGATSAHISNPARSSPNAPVKPTEATDFTAKDPTVSETVPPEKKMRLRSHRSHYAPQALHAPATTPAEAIPVSLNPLKRSRDEDTSANEKAPRKRHAGLHDGKLEDAQPTNDYFPRYNGPRELYTSAPPIQGLTESEKDEDLALIRKALPENQK